MQERSRKIAKDDQVLVESQNTSISLMSKFHRVQNISVVYISHLRALSW